MVVTSRLYYIHIMVVNIPTIFHQHG